MRIWDVPPSLLCHKHLVAEHRELHGLWNIITKHGAKGGYSKHPETLRWIGKSKALFLRHEALVKEFAVRGYNHATPLDETLAKGEAVQTSFINTIPEQIEILQSKDCFCPKT